MTFCSALMETILYCLRGGVASYCRMSMIHSYSLTPTPPAFGAPIKDYPVDLPFGLLEQKLESLGYFEVLCALSYVQPFLLEVHR